MRTDLTALRVTESESDEKAVRPPASCDWSLRSASMVACTFLSRTSASGLGCARVRSADVVSVVADAWSTLSLLAADAMAIDPAATRPSVLTRMAATPCFTRALVETSPRKATASSISMSSGGADETGVCLKGWSPLSARMATFLQV